MVKKVITNLDLSKASGPDCIPVVVLKNCEPELCYILAGLFNKFLRESCFPYCWKVSSVVPQLVSFDGSNNNGADIDVKMDGSVLEEKLVCKQ